MRRPRRAVASGLALAAALGFPAHAGHHHGLGRDPAPRVIRTADAGTPRGSAPGPSASDDPVRRDLERMQGLWTLVSLEVNGRKADPDQVRSWVLVIEGQVYNPGSGETSTEYSFRIDPTRNPRAIDMMPREGSLKGCVLRGVYRLEGDTLTICRALDSENERPAGFRTRPESGLSMVVWKRKP